MNIAVAVAAGAHRDLYDVAYILSADTDLVPAMKEVRSIVNRSGARTKEIVAVFPPIAQGRTRFVSALQQNSDRNIGLNINHIQSCRLPDLVVDQNGQQTHCPAKYL